MKKYFVTGIVLSVFALVCGLLLALVNYVTAPKIAEATQAKIDNSIAEILGVDSVESDPFVSTFDVQTVMEENKEADKKWKSTSVKIKESYKVGNDYVFYLIDTKGFASTISVMIGVNKNGSIEGSSVISQSETKGNVAKWDFKVDGLDTINSKKDVNMLAGSTFSSMAMVRAYQTAIAAAKVDLGGNN